MYYPGIDAGLARMIYAERLREAADQRAAQKGRPSGPARLTRWRLTGLAILAVGVGIIWMLF